MDHYNSQLVAACEKALGQIRKKHPDVPASVIVIASGTEGQARGRVKLGHFGAERWHDGTKRTRGAKKGSKKAREAAAVHEIMLGGEGLLRGGLDVFGTLLHEGAHGIAFTRGIKDTSRGGRYHNQKFKALAEEIGLDVEQDGAAGWTATTVTKATAKQWAKTIAMLDKAIAKSYRSGEPQGAKKKAPGRMLLAECYCDPPRKIRLARAVFDAAAITCGGCEQDFELEDPEK
jgi:hypothetical protein